MSHIVQQTRRERRAAQRYGALSSGDTTFTAPGVSKRARRRILTVVALVAFAFAFQPAITVAGNVKDTIVQLNAPPATPEEVSHWARSTQELVRSGRPFDSADVPTGVTVRTNATISIGYQHVDGWCFSGAITPDGHLNTSTTKGPCRLSDAIGNLGINPWHH